MQGYLINKPICVQDTIFKMCYFYFIFLTNICLIHCQQYLPVSDGVTFSGDYLKHVANNLTSDEALKVLTAKDVSDKFLIKSNTIIRTGESRSLGAKYLNESRLPSNHDCLVWCLETFTCNAAVYEEKNMQSCYLFDCGSPAKPLCKFTSHVLFISSILKMSHHSYELSQWGKQVQLERKTVEFTSTTTSTTTTLVPSSTVKVNACHHYQFECVNSSECIAIYNVCDGIPQCPDGSDESTDIKCPHKAGMASNKISPPDKVSPPIDNSRLPPNAFYPPAFQNVPQKPQQADQQSDYGWPPFSGLQMPKTHYPSEGPSPFVHKHSQFISAADPHVQNLNRWATDYSDPYAHPPMQYESDYDTRPEDLDTSYTAADEFSQSQKMLGYPVKDYVRTDEEDQYPEAKIGMRKLPMQEDYKMQRYGPPHYVHSQHPETKSYGEDLIKLPKTSGHSSLVHHSATKAPDKVKAKSLERTVLDFKMSVAEVYESSHSHSHEANSAILALVLGISVSILLALLLVCRLKTLGRRKGRVLAHDADYLVNGMYL